MKGILDVQGWSDALASSFAILGEAAAGYLPHVVAAIVILTIGWIVSYGAGWLSKWILRGLGVDRVATKTGVGDILKRAGIAAPPSAILGQLLFIVLLLVFARAAFESLQLLVAIEAIDGLVAFLPKLVASGLILLLGVLIGRLAANLVSSAAATARLPQAPRLGAAAYGLFLLVAGVMALERLGVETEILVTTVTAMVAAVAVTMGAAFALGAKPLVTHILAGHFLRQSLPTDAVVEFRGKKGVIERIGPVDTVLRGDEQSWSIANGHLLDEVVGR